MKKLTLEQLAIYLPYGLKLYRVTKGYPASEDICRILEWTATDINMPFNKRYHVKSCKPILHHLSNYTDINSDAMNALNVDISTHIEINDVAIKYKSYLSVSHEAVKVMAQNLMDFMWLIDEGVAVDSNNLK